MPPCTGSTASNNECTSYFGLTYDKRLKMPSYSLFLVANLLSISCMDPDNVVFNPNLAHDGPSTGQCM